MRKNEIKRHSEDLGMDGRVILECIIRKYCGKVWTGSMGLRIGTSGCCEHGNEPSGSIKG
jgi:hypothetical protein